MPSLSWYSIGDASRIFIVEVVEVGTIGGVEAVCNSMVGEQLGRIERRESRERREKEKPVEAQQLQTKNPRRRGQHRGRPN